MIKKGIQIRIRLSGKDARNMSHSYYNLGKLLLKKDEADDGIYWIKQAIKILQKYSPKKSCAMARRLIAEYTSGKLLFSKKPKELLQIDIQEALKYANEALEDAKIYYSKRSNNYIIAECHLYLGDVYIAMSDFRKAEEHISIAEKITEQWESEDKSNKTAEVLFSRANLLKAGSLNVI
jgi:tetratricopeptide (TPR) repeat protein